MRRVSTCLIVGAASIALNSCASSHAKHASERAWYPVPDVAPDTSSAVRGNSVAAGALSNDDQRQIVSFVLRTFYQPTNGQARWLDPRPLAHTRSAADDTVGADPDFADEVVASTRNSRTCVLDYRDSACRGKAGGVVRFSWPYRVGKDSAIVFGTYAPRDSAGKTSPVQSEMQFRLKWHSDDQYWETVGKSAVFTAPNKTATSPTKPATARPHDG